MLAAVVIADAEDVRHQLPFYPQFSRMIRHVSVRFWVGETELVHDTTTS